MPLKQDPHGGGTEADGAINPMYCSNCYHNGSFSLPNISAVEMQQRVKGKLKEFGIPGFLTGFVTRNIPKLERWQQGKYHDR